MEGKMAVLARMKLLLRQEAGGKHSGGNGEGARNKDRTTDGKAEFLNESPHKLTRMGQRKLT